MVYFIRRFILSLAVRVFFFSLCFFSPISIAFTTLEDEIAGLCAFCAFVCFARDGLDLFPLPPGVKDWLRLVIVAFPGLFLLPF